MTEINFFWLVGRYWCVHDFWSLRLGGVGDAWVWNWEILRVPEYSIGWGFRAGRIVLGFSERIEWKFYGMEASTVCRKGSIDLGGGTVIFLEDFVENLGAKFIKGRVRQTKGSTEKSYRRRVNSKKIQSESLKMLKMILILRKIAVHIILNTFMIFSRWLLYLSVRKG